MKRINSILLSLILIISLTITSFAQIDVNINTNENGVIIQGTTDYNNESITIQINDGKKKVYFDEECTDSSGNFDFKTQLDNDKEYKGYVILGQEKKDFEFKTSQSEENKENEKTNQQVIKETLDKLKEHYKNKDEFTFREAIGYYAVSDNKERDIFIIKSKFKEKEDLMLATDYAGNIIGLIASRQDPKKYVEKLVNSQEKGIFNIGGMGEEVNQIGWSVIALDMANANYDKEGAVSKLINKQHENGNFEDADTTAMCIMALSKHTDIEGVNNSINKAKEFLLKNKEYIVKDANECTIAAVIQGLVSIGENPLSSKWTVDNKNMFSSLLKYKKEDTFKNEMSTEQAFMAIADLYKKESMFTKAQINNEGFNDLFKKQESEENSEESKNEEIKEENIYITIKGHNRTIISRTKVEIEKGDTVLDILKRILQKEGIEYSTDGEFVTAIDGIEQKDIGLKSGWMFNIDGKTADVGADSIKVKDGQDIEWFYTLDYTKDSRNTNKNVEKENVDDIISNKEYKDIYSKIVDKNSSEKEIIKAVDDVSNKINKKIDNIKTEKEAKEIIDDIKDISKIIQKASQKIDSQEGNKDIAEKSVKLINNTVKVYEKVNDKEAVYKILAQNIGTTLNIINNITDETTANTAIEDIIEASLKIENKIPICVQGSKEVEAKLPSVFINKAVEKNIDKIEIKTDIASFNINPNSLDKGKNINLKAKKIDTSDLSKNQNNVVPDNSIVIDVQMNDGKENITKFKHPIEVTIPYEKSAKNKDKVNVFYLKDDGTLENMGGVYNEKTKTVKFITNHFSKYFAKEYTKEFSDLDSTKWAKDSVEIMACKGIINGKENNKFSPNDNITRAEFAALITRMLKYQESDNELLFKDVNKGEWYYDSVNTAYQNKIINGKNETVFDPNGNITRQEMAKIISNVLESKGYKKGNSEDLNAFKDRNDIASWAEESVGLSVKERLITGMDNGTFAPNEKATRAQAAVMLYRLYNLIMN